MPSHTIALYCILHICFATKSSETWIYLFTSNSTYKKMAVLKYSSIWKVKRLSNITIVEDTSTNKPTRTTKSHFLWPPQSPISFRIPVFNSNSFRIHSHFSSFFFCTTRCKCEKIVLYHRTTRNVPKASQQITNKIKRNKAIRRWPCVCVCVRYFITCAEKLSLFNWLKVVRSLTLPIFHCCSLSLSLSFLSLSLSFNIISFVSLYLLEHFL